MSVSLVTARRKLGQEIGPYGVYTATGGSTTTFSYFTFFSSVLPDDTFAYEWVYVPSVVGTGRLRRVTATGLNNGTGVVTLDGPLGSAVAAGTLVELSALLPPVRDISPGVGESNYLSLNDCLDLATRHLLVDDDTLTTLTLVNGQRTYSLSAYPWLVRSGRLTDVRVLDAVGNDYTSTHHRWELRESGHSSALFFPTPFRFSSGSYTARLVCQRPAWTLIKLGGVTWVASTTGFSNETDEVDLDLDQQLIPVAKVFAYQSLRDRTEGAEQATYAALYADALRMARRVKGYDTTNEIDADVPSAAPATAGAA